MGWRWGRGRWHPEAHRAPGVCRRNLVQLSRKSGWRRWPDSNRGMRVLERGPRGVSTREKAMISEMLATVRDRRAYV